MGHTGTGPIGSSNESRGDEQCANNTDVEIWRKTPGDFYSPSIHVTKEGAIGINVGGLVIVRSVQEWHECVRKAIEFNRAEAGMKPLKNERRPTSKYAVVHENLKSAWKAAVRALNVARDAGIGGNADSIEGIVLDISVALEFAETMLDADK